MATIHELTESTKNAMQKYREDFPEVQADRDYYPFKLTEEWGECMQAYLMLTNRGRQKGLSKEEIQTKLKEEFADVFGFLLLFAANENIDLEEVLEEKWLSRIA